jgi:short-subunit dehydrogenase
MMRVTKAVLPHMRANRKGLIINASSSAGRYSWPLLSLYNASKCAIEGLTETLLYELEPLGIGVKLIEPDKIRTEFGTGVIAAQLDESLRDYEAYTDRVFATMQRWSEDPNQGTPTMVAELVYTAATDGKKQLRYLLGDELHYMVAMKATLSDEQFTDLVRQRFCDPEASISGH